MKLLFLLALAAAISAGFPLDADKTRQLFAAIRKGDDAALRALVDGDPALVDARGEDGLTGVRTALYYRRPDLANLLIEKGARLDVYDAAASGSLARLGELLDAEPGSANSHSSDGATPLGLAAFFGHLEAVKLLLDRGANPSVLMTNPAFPFAPLHSAMSAGHREIVFLLLGRGADVNLREGGGVTVLHEAAGIGNTEFVRSLLDHGANPAAKTDDGKLPEDFARTYKHEQLADLLAQARKDWPAR